MSIDSNWGGLMRRVGQVIFCVVVALGVSSCGSESDQIIDDLNDIIQQQDGVYYDENCLDLDGDGWCDDQGDYSGGGDVYYDENCLDLDGDGWCDDQGDYSGGGDVYYDENCLDLDGDGWCD